MDPINEAYKKTIKESYMPTGTMPIRKFFQWYAGSPNWYKDWQITNTMAISQGGKREHIQDMYSKSQIKDILDKWWKDNDSVAVKKIADDEVRIDMPNGDELYVQTF